jgi:hypothetical protein
MSKVLPQGRFLGIVQNRVTLNWADAAGTGWGVVHFGYFWVTDGRVEVAGR